MNAAKPLEREVMLRYAVDRISSGSKPAEVLPELMEKFKVNETNALQILNDSKQGIKNQMQIRVPFILSIHIERYEFLHKKFLMIGRTDLQNKCLSQKEELLNLRQALSQRLAEDFVTEEIENKFNYNKLPKEKQARVLELLAKGIV